MDKTIDRRIAMKLGATAGLGVFSDSGLEAKGDAPKAAEDLNQISIAKKSPGYHMMPAHFGPMSLFNSAPEGTHHLKDLVYHDITSLSVTYLTDHDRLQKFLPDSFKVTEKPLVRAAYTMNRQIDWLAGGDYNIVGVYVPAVFNGTQDKVAGVYCMVLWENLTDPILVGRELAGIPKIFGDIEDHTIVNGIWRTSLSNRGHKILDMTVSELKPMDAEFCKTLEQGAERQPMLGWRYIPDGKDGAALSHGTVFPYAIKVREASLAKGKIQWYDSSWEKNPMQFHIVNALKALPIVEIQSALVWKGSLTLHASKIRKQQ